MGEKVPFVFFNIDSARKILLYNSFLGVLRFLPSGGLPHLFTDEGGGAPFGPEIEASIAGDFAGFNMIGPVIS